MPRSPPHPTTLVARYGLAVVLTALALATRLALAPHLEQQPFTTFFVAVVLAAFLTGPGPTVATVVLGYLAAEWFFLEPHHAFGPHSRSDWGRIVAYVSTSAIVVAGSTWLARARDRAEASRRELEREIAERRRTEEALRSSEEALRQADRRKDEFLGVLSHELRNPLAPIRNSVHVLERADPGSEQAERARAVIARQVDHLARLVDDLLDVKRISTGKLRLHASTLDLRQPVRETVEDLRPLFVHRSLALDLHLPEAPVWVCGDRTRLSQVLTNLLHNAAKFTDAGGHVAVSLEASGGQARIRVRDDGVGIAPEVVGTLFEAFVQSDTTLHRTKGGLGLGLALVRGIAELHGGSVSAHSEGVGKGTEFVVTLPASGPRAPATEVTPSSERGGSRRVLVVEDNVDAAESLRDLLTTFGGHEVHLARDGEEGVASARQHAPDVVLCDIGLPVLDGYEVARRIRAGPSPAPRLVALSGYASQDDVDRAIRAGFDFHVSKPPDVEKVLALVAEAPRCTTHEPELDSAEDASASGQRTDPSRWSRKNS